MIDAIEKTIRTQGLFSAATPVVAMVSGGSDSTALAYLVSDLYKRGLVGQPAILHVNHLLRGEDAYADQRFVEKLAAIWKSRSSRARSTWRLWPKRPVAMKKLSAEMSVTWQRMKPSKACAVM